MNGIESKASRESLNTHAWFYSALSLNKPNDISDTSNFVMNSNSVYIINTFMRLSPFSTMSDGNTNDFIRNRKTREFIWNKYCYLGQRNKWLPNGNRTFQNVKCSSTEWNETPPIPSWRLVALEQQLNDRYQCHWHKKKIYRSLKCSMANVENAFCVNRIIQRIKLQYEL